MLFSWVVGLSFNLIKYDISVRDNRDSNYVKILVIQELGKNLMEASILTIKIIKRPL